MKYNLKEYNKSVKEYKKDLEFLKNKLVLVEFPFVNEKAFNSLAPLSNALHELNSDLSVSLHSGHPKNLEIMESAWLAFAELKDGEKNPKTKALDAFIKETEKKAGKGKISNVFREPDAWIFAEKECFIIECKNKIWFIPFREKWFKERQKKGLLKTTKAILKEGFAFKKGERLAVGFELVPAKKDLELPLDDYLDNFSIARAMALTAENIGSAGMGAGTARKSKTDPMNRIAELKTIISGCEHDKKVKEPVFQKYAVLSPKIGADKWENSDAVFSIAGKGYGGKHLFGTTIGYPSPNRKTRWPSPGLMFLKPWWNMQSAIDKRQPKMRYGLTETLPIENFIRTCNVNYPEMRARNAAIQKAIAKSDKLIVKGVKVKGGQTKLEVQIKGKKVRRLVLKSDSDAREKLNKAILKEKGIISGMFANFPGGEAFLTPESITGTAVGDVVINIDRSHLLKADKPLVVEFNKGTWKLKSAPALIKKRMEKELRDGKKLIAEYEKKKALPKAVTKMYRDNFRNTGEFAVNTNPKAKLGNYLIENEKIARMIHIALGSGFEPDRQTVYHWDFVINSPRQKLDIYGIDSKGEKHWVIKKGKFAL